MVIAYELKFCMQGPQYFHFNTGAWFSSLSLLSTMRQLINDRSFVVAVQSHTGIMLIVAKNRVINCCVSLVDCWLMESIIICLQRVWCNRGSVMVVISCCLRTRDYLNKRSWSIDLHCLIFDHLIVAKGEKGSSSLPYLCCKKQRIFVTKEVDQLIDIAWSSTIWLLWKE